MLVSVIHVAYHDKMRDFMICSAKEEDLRYNLDNFLIEEEYPESLTTLPWYHPYELLVQIICRVLIKIYAWQEALFFTKNKTIK